MTKLRFFLIAWVAICSLTISAKHLNFMGIPINGTIASFQSKLQAKGCSIFKDNDQLPVGVRGFEGIFAGKKSLILVWYNSRSKQVYKVQVATDGELTIDEAHSTFNYYKDMLNNKYDGQAFTSDMYVEPNDNQYEFDMNIFDPPIQDMTKVIGTIKLRILDYDLYPITYCIVITYEDLENSLSNEHNILNDL